MMKPSTARMAIARMPIRSIGLAMLLPLLLAAGLSHADSPERKAATRSTEVIRLLDGQSLDPFYTFLKETQYEDPHNVFRITDGMIHVTGDGEVVWKPGGQRETFDNDNRSRINWFGRDPDWKDTSDFRGDQDVESPGQQWTRIDTICDGGRVEVFVNGVKVNEALDVYPSYGRLQLQTELAEIFVRRWELWPLDQAPAPAKAKP